MKVHHEGFQDETQNVTIAVGQAHNLAINLKAAPAPPTTTASAKPAAPPSTNANPFSKIGRFFKGDKNETGTISITTKPAGAKISLNGKASSSLTPVTVETKVGHYKVLIEMDGYQPVQREVDIEKGKQTGIEETLVRK